MVPTGGWAAVPELPVITLIILAAASAIRVGHWVWWPPLCGSHRQARPVTLSATQTRADPPVKLRERYARPGTGPDPFGRASDRLLTGEQQTNVRATTMAGAW